MKSMLCLTLSAFFVFGTALSPKITKGKSAFLQAVKDVFHYSAGDAERPKPKAYPEKFEKDMKRQIRYPGSEIK